MSRKSDLVRRAKARRLAEVEALAGKLRQDVCGNAQINVVLESENPEKFEFNYGIENKGCKNQRRYNSKYCQECSDKHNQI